MNLKKVFNWEYWPSFMFYIPNLPYAVYLAIKARNPVFFSAANPAIKHSGNGTESKYATLQLIPKKHRPKTLFIKKNTPIETTLNSLLNSTISYPIIVKPDIGFRGLLVERIQSENALVNYLKKHNNLDILIQEFIALQNECGIFYHKIPNGKNGKITSITLKKYLTVKGNGKDTLLELIEKDERAKIYCKLLQKMHEKSLKSVLKKDETKVLTVIGNHSKGTQFINGNSLISKKLEKVFDQLTNEIPNWFYGRFDLKYNTFDDLVLNKNFKILELNGIISEPTHIYDASSIGYMEALKEIRKHWKILFKIATKNHLINNVHYDTTIDFLKSIWKLKSYTKQIKKQSAF